MKKISLYVVMALVLALVLLTVWQGREATDVAAPDLPAVSTTPTDTDLPAVSTTPTDTDSPVAADIQAASIPDQTCPDPVPEKTPDGTVVCTIIVDGSEEARPTSFSSTATHSSGDWDGAFAVSNSGVITVQDNSFVTVDRSPIVLNIMGMGGRPEHIYGNVTINVVAAESPTEQ